MLQKLQNLLDGCQVRISKWNLRGRSLFRQPGGFKLTENQDYVCKLKKALCGLKQTPRA
jgi:hypothetical protein